VRRHATGGPFKFSERNIVTFKKNFNFEYLLFIIRERKTYLKSLYSYHIKLGGTKRFNSFSTDKEILLKINHRLIKKVLKKHFSNKIIFVDFEEMTRKPEEFIKRISKISGIELSSINKDFTPINVSNDHFSNKIKRLVNLSVNKIFLHFILKTILRTFQFFKKRIKI